MSHRIEHPKRRGSGWKAKSSYFDDEPCFVATSAFEDEGTVSYRFLLSKPVRSKRTIEVGRDGVVLEEPIAHLSMRKRMDFSRALPKGEGLYEHLLGDPPEGSRQVEQASCNY